jgi:acetyl-CoA carboxylase biotin carboxyl carrier protein
MALSDDDVREILRLIDESKLDELRIETPEFKLHVLRGDRAAPPEEPAERAQEPAEAAPAREAAPEAALAPEAAPAAAQAGPAAAAPAPGAAARNGARTIEAPMLGTFYRAEAPGATPFVDVGAEVEPGTVVCLIEVMKMMNSIQAGVAGTIVEVCAENAQLVQYGDPLFRVEPAA